MPVALESWYPVVFRASLAYNTVYAAQKYMPFFGTITERAFRKNPKHSNGPALWIFPQDSRLRVKYRFQLFDYYKMCQKVTWLMFQNDNF